MRPALPAVCLAVAAAMSGQGGARAASPSTLSVCIDGASATASRDEAVARQAASRENVPLALHRFDSADDQEGLGAADFLKLLAKHCDVVLGYPVGTTGGAPPSGLSMTAPYDETGFVLVTAPPLPAGGMKALPANTTIAVTFGAVPTLFVVTYPALQSDIQLSEDATLRALTSGRDKAAILWQPTFEAYHAGHQSAPHTVQKLTEPHARFDIVALYGPGGTAAARLFQDGLAAPVTSGEPAAAGKRHGAMALRPFVQRAADRVGGQEPALAPALYTTVQAGAGERKYADDCAQCHGSAMEGQSGPALKGRLFASVRTGFTVGDILNFMAVNMPATQPGSLSHEDYTDIMAYVLAQNGFPAGAKALDFDGGTQSRVPLLYYGRQAG